MLVRRGKKDSKFDVVKRNFKIKIFCICHNRIVLDINVENRTLIGILLSGFNTFENGHIYYRNNVIKIRYDLLTKEGANFNRLTEDEVFNHYEDIFF